MTPAHLLLAIGMLISGSLNTITTSYAQNEHSLGTWQVATIWSKMTGGAANQDHAFDHPFFQALGMFVGEFLCMLTYLATRSLSSRRAARDLNISIDEVEHPGGRTKGAFWFAIPALLDITGTGTMYAGLCMSYPSVFQMLRGSVVVFTCILSVVFLKRKIYRFQWFSVLLIVIGITIVGWVSVAHSGQQGGKDQTSVLIGEILIVLAQICTAIQMCVEEKLFKLYPTPPLKAVGLEGTFGFLALSILLVPMYYIRFDGLPFENTPDAVAQVSHNYVIVLAICGNALSIAFFNFFGMSVTQQMSAAHRMVLDSVRTVVVWTASLILFHEPFLPWQLLGFFILSMGTATYNEIIKLPFFEYPADTLLPLDASTQSATLCSPRRDRTVSNLSATAKSTSSLYDALVKEASNHLSTSFIRM